MSTEFFSKSTQNQNSNSGQRLDPVEAEVIQQFPKDHWPPENYLELWALSQSQDRPNTVRYVGASAVVHAIGLLLLAFVTVRVFEKPESETITFEIQDRSPQRIIRNELPVVATKINAPKVIANKIKEPQIKVAQEKPAAPKIQAKSLELPGGMDEGLDGSLGKVQPVKSIAGIIPKTKVIATSAKLDDDKNSEPNFAQAARGTPSHLYKDGEVEEDLRKAQSRNKYSSSGAQQNLQRIAGEADSDFKQQNDSLKNAWAQDSKSNKDLSDRLGQEGNSLEGKVAASRAALAKQIADERARGLGGVGNGTGSGQNQKNPSGTAASRTQAENPGNGAGSGIGPSEGEVRTLSQLQQKPGNPIPHYSESERLAGYQGRIVLWAYVSKDGVPSRFILKQSTGYRSLDAKTLNELKKWRFFAGQEGWVELPFEWNLHGGGQMLSPLRKYFGK